MIFKRARFMGCSLHGSKKHAALKQADAWQMPHAKQEVAHEARMLTYLAPLQRRVIQVYPTV